MTARRLDLLAVLLVVCVAAPGWAFHTVFDFTVDRFTVDGNQQGPFDGTPDFVDEFNGSATSNWYTPYGTSSVSGGRLHVQSPGVHFPGPGGTSLDLTEVVSAYPSRIVGKGSGNFTATAVFDPVVPPEGHFYHFTLYTFGGGQYFNENFGIDIHTENGETRIEQHLVIIDIFNGIYQTVQTSGQTIAPADITGQLHFRLSYDDTAGTIVTSFSLDGGQTFQSPFPGAPIFTLGRNLGQFLLGADPHTSGAVPSTTTTTAASTTTTTTTTAASTTTTTTIPLAIGQCLRTDCKTAPRGTLDLRAPNGRLAWTWRNGAAASPAELGDPTRADGPRYALCLRDGTNLLFSAVTLPGGTCAGKSCWRVLPGLGFSYRGDPKAVDAMRTLKIVSGVHSQVKATSGVGALGGPIPVTAPLTAQLEADTGACWSTTFDAAELRTNGAGRVRAKR